MQPAKALLIILDGWGLGQRPADDAIAQADTPVFDRLYRDNPHGTLVTYGEEVGLPEGQMGNSEVGHLNIGAGRVVYQSFARINKSIRDGELEKMEKLQEVLRYARDNDKKVHFIGLLSDGGVHSHINHLLRLTEIATAAGNEKVYIHAFTDGRDVAPTSATGYLETLLNHIHDSPAKLASVTGRFFAMDRDTRWERIETAYDAMVRGKGERSQDAIATLEERYAKEQTDEFIDPVIMTNNDGQPVATIDDGDLVINFNFRTDRPRQITRCLTQEDFGDFNMKRLPNLRYLCLTQYDANFTDVEVLFSPTEIKNPLGQVVSEAGKTQVRIAETEKYAHVTFFLNGGEETEFEGEKRILIDSPRDVKTYDERPEMSVYEVTDAIVNEVDANQPDLIVLNYANTDMVGHTGNWEAAKEAAVAVDKCMGRLLETVGKYGYHSLIIADHGNSDVMRNEDGTVHTAHTTNPVPVVYAGPAKDELKIRGGGKLGDVAPTLLKLMGVEQPSEMTGESLV